MVYIFLVLFCFITSYAYTRVCPKSRLTIFHPLLLICLFSVCIVCGIRYGVGVDYFSYYDCYIKSANISNGFAHMEKGWSIISEGMSKLGIHFTLYFALIAGVQFFFVIEAFKKHSNLLPYGILVFFLMGEFIIFMNVLRQTIIIAVFLFIVMAKPNVKLWQLIAISLVFSLIHKTALLMILFYPVIMSRKTWNIYPAVLVIIYLFCIRIGLNGSFLEDFLSNPLIINIIGGSDYASYIKDPAKAMAGTENQVGLGYMLICMVNILVILLYKKLTISSHNYIEYSKWFYLWIIGLFLSTLTPNSIIMSRMTMLLTIFSIPVYALVLRNTIGIIKKGYPFETIAGWFIMCSMWLVFLFSYILKPQPTTKYVFFWEHMM